MKIWMSVLLMVLALPAAAPAMDGFVAFGAYFDQQNVYSRPDGGEAAYRSEVEIGHRMAFLKGYMRPYLNFMTLMDAYNGNGTFHPASINYTVGIGWERALSQRLTFFSRIKHFCWHPVDSNGTVAQANYIEFGFRF